MIDEQAKINHILSSADELERFATSLQLSTKAASELLYRCLHTPTVPKEVTDYLWQHQNDIDAKSYICGEEVGYVRGHEAGFVKGAVATLATIAATGLVMALKLKK